ncbi:hypothetical protein ABS772_05225 [Methylorubrum podarium]|uniref:PH domain-containing protein n=1 Tax=Methylorubrum podarium TaxID=200476 RepID=A0ABV1QIT7_9HYPH
MGPRIPTRSGPSRRALFGLTVSLAFVAIGAGMIIAGADIGSGGVIFFGVCAAVFAWQLWPNLLETERRPPEILLACYPGPVVLRGAARKHLFFSAGTAALGGVGLQMLLAEQLPLLMQILVWPGVVLFLGGAPLLLFIAVRGTSLQLDGGGLLIGDGWRVKRLSWSDADGFTTATVAGSSTRMVVFDDTTTGDTRLARLNRTLVGRNAALSDTFGLDPDDLAALLTAWRARALQAGAEPGSVPPERR